MAAEEIPSTPGIQEVSTRRPFDSARGSRVPFKIGDNYDDVGEFDIKRMEKQAAQLEKDLIMKELETLDFLEALGSTKKIVQGLKLELQKQAMGGMENPEHLLRSHIKKMNGEEEHGYSNPLASPDLTFMGLNQARMNVGKTMDDLALIQTCVESLSIKTEEEKDSFGVASLAEELNSLRLKPAGPDQGESFSTEKLSVNPQCEQVKRVIDSSDTTFHKQSETCLRTAELRLVAARKMEEAARAAEALAIAEMTIISSGKNQDGFFFPEPPRSPLAPKDLSTNISRIDFTRKLEEANEEVKQSKQALETALNRVEMASVKQLEAEEAFRQWNIESWKDQKAIRPKRHVNEPLIDLPKPMLKRNVSIGNVLNRKQVPTVDEKELATPRRKFRFIHITVPLERQSKQKPSL